MHPLRDETADLVIRVERQSLLYAAIEKLPEAQRRRLLLHYFEGFTYSQIAEMECVTHAAVISSIRQAKKNLKKLLDS